MSVEEIYPLVLRSIVDASCTWTMDALRAFRESLKKIGSTQSVPNGTALCALLSKDIPMRLSDAEVKQQLSAVVYPPRRVAPRKLRLLRRSYNVDLLLGFVLGVVLTIAFSIVLRWGMVQIAQP